MFHVMKMLQSLLTFLVLFGAMAIGQAQILMNDFSSVSSGSYTVGSSFGGALLGNVSGNDNITVGSTGVNGSNGATARDLAIRSSGTHALASNTSFSLFFQFDYNNSIEKTGGFVGAGWALSSGTDNSNIFSGNGDDRFLVGMESTALLGGDPPTAATVNLAYGGRMSALTNDFTGGVGDTLQADLTVGNWYELAFDLQFQPDEITPGNSTFDVANLTVKNWGSDGLTGGSTVLSLASQTGIGIGSNNGANLGGETSAYAFIAANGQRGAGAGFDNIDIAVVPEPTTHALLVGSFALGLLQFNRRRRS